MSQIAKGQAVGVLQEQKNPKKQGDVGLGIAIGWFTQHGYTVSIPLTDSQDYDLVVEVEGKLCKVQVRTTYHRKQSGSHEVNLRVCGGNRSGLGKIKYFDPESVDFLFVLTEGGAKYLIPSDKIRTRRSITLGARYAKYMVE